VRIDDVSSARCASRVGVAGDGACVRAAAAGAPAAAEPPAAAELEEAAWFMDGRPMGRRLGDVRGVLAGDITKLCWRNAETEASSCALAAGARESYTARASGGNASV
jgi:hypothetical protein